MTSSIRIRTLTPGDLEFADEVRARAGWNQTRDDWRRFLALEPQGCFLAEWNGTPAGTATTLIHGAEVAWIGMVLVHPDYRRRGVGRALLEHGIASLHQRGVRCVKLDATPAGKQVYDALGFRDEWTLQRWERAAGPSSRQPHPSPPAPLPSDGNGSRPAAEPREGASPCFMDPIRVQNPRVLPAQRPVPASLRPWNPACARSVEALDAGAFGVSRVLLIEALAPVQTGAWIAESDSRRITAYGLSRPGSRAAYLGPVVGEDADAGLAVVAALLDGLRGGPVYWDIPDPNAAAVDWARAQGFTPQRPLTRMFLGENLRPGDPRRQFALSGPETG